MLKELDVENLSAEEIEILLSCGSDILSPSQVLEVQLFVQRIGGLANAYEAVRVLKNLEAAG
ncbi:hypothetical protein [Blastopirellula marina]|uniref:Uncharacterized protein n=1 Tax=Blastopirellula marina TaxID=124 RepID=A0A2S8GJW0_9BACT|nr:hypothetical protein [Blastopirellula marina]PQO44725.1 hypothetical protein C5Y93_18350 [Blastopirellula marina]